MSLQPSYSEQAQEEIQKTLVAAMMEPEFYPKPPTEVTHKETHISHLFFAGDLVYKIKKSVRHSFLDFSTPGKRRHFLSEELRLNRRLAPSVYLAVVPIARNPSGWRLSAEGEAVEYALVMRRLPEKRMLSFLLDTHQVTTAMMHDLAGLIANFHAAAPPARRIEPQRHLAVLEKLWNDNMADLQPFLGESIDRDVYRIVDRFGTDFVRDYRGLLTRRAEQGWIRDIHGDLHCEHICFAPEGIQIFDCVEFSSQLRCGDVASEVALLLMDLEVRGGKAMAKPFLSRYCELLEDPELPLLLPFYECYRALVRGKLNAIRSQGKDGAAARYFRYAARMTWQPLRPFLVLLCGLTGSGKTTLAEELSQRLGLPMFSSDVIRKSLAAKPGRDNDVGIYRQPMTEKTYGKIVREAEKQILAGRGAILDATFAQRANREKVSRMAAKHNIPVFLIHCFATDAIIKHRLVQQATEGLDLSDSLWKIYVEQKARCEPPSEIPVQNYLELNTMQPVTELAAVCERFLRSRLDPREAYA
jgi:aminoglycoside phosphotransferase family enzyme/predicted kinase